MIKKINELGEEENFKRGHRKNNDNHSSNDWIDDARLLDDDELDGGAKDDTPNICPYFNPISTSRWTQIDSSRLMLRNTGNTFWINSSLKILY